MLTEALSDYLTRKVPHEIQIYHTGEECLKKIDSSIDAVILDIRLNSVDKNAADGMKILHTIKKIYPHIYVIMLSGQERYSIALETIHQGADQYIIKDEEAFEKILETINNL